VREAFGLGRAGLDDGGGRRAEGAATAGWVVEATATGGGEEGDED
jgi:hypothetical protein